MLQRAQRPARAGSIALYWTMCSVLVVYMLQQHLPGPGLPHTWALAATAFNATALVLALAGLWKACFYSLFLKPGAVLCHGLVACWGLTVKLLRATNCVCAILIAEYHSLAGRVEVAFVAIFPICYALNGHVKVSAGLWTLCSLAACCMACVHGKLRKDHAHATQRACERVAAHAVNNPPEGTQRHMHCTN
jgi:hypothetical protein